jgi:hypothetical protein
MKALAMLAGVCAMLAGCVSYSRWDPEFDTAPEPVRTDWTLVKQRCSGCHTLEKVFLKINTSIMKDRDSIQFTVEGMADETGSGIREAEIPRIVDTLEWYRANH